VTIRSQFIFDRTDTDCQQIPSPMQKTVVTPKRKVKALGSSAAPHSNKFGAPFEQRMSTNYDTSKQRREEQ